MTTTVEKNNLKVFPKNKGKVNSIRYDCSAGTAQERQKLSYSRRMS